MRAAGYHKGMCIGGPMDGKWKTHHTSVFQVEEMPSFTPREPSIVQALMNIKTTVYLFVSYKDGNGFWVPSDEPQTMDHVMKQLTEIYWQYAELQH